MLCETITYTDYNGVERTEKFHFNLTQEELMVMEMGTAGGFVETMQKIVDAKDAPAIIRAFKNLISKAYGVKSDDGRRFIKSDEISREFEQTEAYSQLFMKLATDADYASKFVEGILPKDLKPKTLPAAN